MDQYFMLLISINVLYCNVKYIHLVSCLVERNLYIVNLFECSGRLGSIASLYLTDGDVNSM